jgi:hypothetical protein
MTGVPHRGQVDVTLGDAFSALLAAEQVAGPAAASSFTGPDAGGEAPGSDGPPVFVTSSSASTTAGPGMSEEQIEAVVRRVLAGLTDQVVREVVNARVLEVAERLVREEIDRLKAEASAAHTS